MRSPSRRPRPPHVSIAVDPGVTRPHPRALSSALVLARLAAADSLKDLKEIAGKQVEALELQIVKHPVFALGVSLT